MLDKKMSNADIEREAQKRADEWREIRSLADVFLSGFIRDKGEGRVSKEYLGESPGEAYEGTEKDGREAIARLLRSGLQLSQDFRDRLAALFDPEADTHPAIDRKLVFEHRASGRQYDAVRDTAIGMFIYKSMQQNISKQKALEEAASYFRMGFEAVRTIWDGDRKKGSQRKGYRRLLEPIYGPLPR
ncbi:MAG: hypothetical protein WA322_01435 [Pseudolabrys sp.]